MFTDASLGLAPPARVVQRAATGYATKVLLQLAEDPVIQGLPYFELPERPGYGVTQAFTSSKDIAYEAAVTVSKAVSSIAGHAEPICDLVLPVIVIDGRPFECYLDAANEVKIGELESGVLVWRNPIVGMPHTIIHVTTRSGLQRLVEEARKVADELFTRDEVVKRVIGKPGGYDPARYGEQSRSG